MGANAQKLPSYSANQEAKLTIYDAPNACRDLMARCQVLTKHPDPEVAKVAGEMYDDAKQMLDAIVASVDAILAMEVRQ